MRRSCVILKRMYLAETTESVIGDIREFRYSESYPARICIFQHHSLNRVNLAGVHAAKLENDETEQEKATFSKKRTRREVDGEEEISSNSSSSSTGNQTAQMTTKSKMEKPRLRLWTHFPIRLKTNLKVKPRSDNGSEGAKNPI